jgi:hypothetical protein
MGYQARGRTRAIYRYLSKWQKKDPNLLQRLKNLFSKGDQHNILKTEQIMIFLWNNQFYRFFMNGRKFENETANLKKRLPGG